MASWFLKKKTQKVLLILLRRAKIVVFDFFLKIKFSKHCFTENYLEFSLLYVTAVFSVLCIC